MTAASRDATAATGEQSPLPLFRRFPALARLPRAPLGHFPTPVVRADALALNLWIKREDLAGDPLGGNKVRSLEFLLGGVRAGDSVVTVGALGSTHVLATATYARKLGARPILYRWPQEMNDAAARATHRIEAGGPAPRSRSIVGAYVRAVLARLRGARWIAAGGSSPLGVLGQVNAALELAQQVEAGLVPPPRRIVVPLGSGGTAAGLALGAHIAGLDTEIVGVRVVPRVVANVRRVRRLASRTARLISRVAGEKVTPPDAGRIRVVHDFYGGAYGRESAVAAAAQDRCARTVGLVVDATYSAKALAAALAVAGPGHGATLFWLTFDGRS